MNLKSFVGPECFAAPFHSSLIDSDCRKLMKSHNVHNQKEEMTSCFAALLQI